MGQRKGVFVNKCLSFVCKSNSLRMCVFSVHIRGSLYNLYSNILCLQELCFDTPKMWRLDQAARRVFKMIRSVLATVSIFALSKLYSPLYSLFLLSVAYICVQQSYFLYAYDIYRVAVDPSFSEPLFLTAKSLFSTSCTVSVLLVENRLVWQMVLVLIKLDQS
jgi:hypothetical protein